MTRVLRMAMVGGGPGSFIGPVHRMAAELDGRIRLVAGAFSSDPQRSRAAGAACGLDPDRAYPNIGALIAGEKARDDGADFISIVTPNHLHLPVARATLEAGFHVMSDKPATGTLNEALALREAVERSGRCYGLTYSYTGYALIRQARAMVASGDIGAIRKVVAEYSQGWLSRPIELHGSKQAEWRVDPARSGIGGCIADIGVHAFNLAEYVTGLNVVELCADLSRLVPGRRLDDDANLLLRFTNGAPGVLHASQIAAGERNDMTIRVWGETGGLQWRHAQPDCLVWERAEAPSQILHAGEAYLLPQVRAMARLPSGHPEGFIEAFGNLYRSFAAAVGGERGILDGDLPGIKAGVRGMAFIETALASSHERRWLQITEIAK